MPEYVPPVDDTAEMLDEQPVSHTSRLSFPGMLRRAAAPAALFAAGSSLAALYVGPHETAETNIASHASVVSLTRDGYATFDLGAHEPTIRTPVDTPLGVGIHVDVGHTEATSTKQLVNRYIAIADQPKGEITNIKDTAVHIGQDIALESGLAGLGVAAMWTVVGPRRRHELWESAKRNRLNDGAAIAAAAVLINSCAVGDIPHPDSPQDSIQTVRLGAIYPGLQLNENLAKIEIEQNALTDTTLQLIRGVIVGYQKSKLFYDNVEGRASLIGPQLRQPQPGDKVALFVADRHDNTAMDAVSSEIGKQGKATLLFDGGDDTATGSEFEAFSPRSLAANTKWIPDRVAVAGNHDHGRAIPDIMAKLGFHMLDGSIREYGGVRIVGLPDPKSSNFVNSDSFDSTSLESQAKELARITCKADREGRRVSTILVHEEQAGAAALAKGCVDLVLAGHIHHFKGPKVVTGENGSPGSSFVTSTAGGATLAASPGPLRRDAGESLVTYHNGVPIGIQKVTVSQGGLVLPDSFEPLPKYWNYYTENDTPLADGRTNQQGMADQSEHSKQDAN